jgi:hypothetical protein
MATIQLPSDFKECLQLLNAHQANSCLQLREAHLWQNGNTLH